MTRSRQLGLLGLALALAASAEAQGGAAGPLDAAYLIGRTDRPALSYRVGETMRFSLTVENAGPVEKGLYFLDWKRQGDDTKTLSGREPLPLARPLVIETSIDRPGFVRILANVMDAKGNVYQKNIPDNALTPDGTRPLNAYERMAKALSFDGSAAAEPERLDTLPEPVDFDGFWMRQRERLAKVPMRVRRKEWSSARPGFRTWAVQVDCAGLRPVTGYLAIPESAGEGRKFPAVITFHGYGGDVFQHINMWGKNPRDGYITFDVNAHGMMLPAFGADEAYMKALRWEIGSHDRTYALDPKQNADPETAYFNGMCLRIMRALEFLKTVPEWNGRDLESWGHSQGGLQAIWAAALDKDVTKASAGVPWCCDMAGGEMGRLRLGWGVPWVAALGYYDPVNMARRIPVTCTVDVMRAGLGDNDCCPPSGIAIFYNRLKCSKRISWVQGSTHGYSPPSPYVERFVFSNACEKAVHVSSNGDDAADGTAARPVRTLAAAQTRARTLGAGTTVWIGEGVYRLRETLALSAADAGIAWRAAKSGKAVISGAFPARGLRRPPEGEISARIPAEARAHVWCADLKEAGYAGLEPFQPYGFRVKDPQFRVTEVYRDGRPLACARHPNSGFLRVQKLVDRNRCVLATDDPILRRLAGESSLQALGYWWNTWADQTYPVVALDPERGTFTMAPETEIGWVPGYFDGRCKFCFVNALATLDEPGEWYLDRETGRLWVWPPEDDGAGRWEISELGNPLVSVDGAKDVSFEGLVFEGGRNHGLVVTNAPRFALRASTVRNQGGNGLKLDASPDASVLRCRFHTFGHAAVLVRGGNRRTLTPSGIRIADCDFSDTGRAQRTYQPGARLAGCGCTVVHCRFHDLPSSAVRVEGNDHLFASNVCERCVLESDDQGVSDSFGNPTFAGNRFIHNLFREVGPKGGGTHWGRSAIRFDDAISGMTVYGNRFENCAQGAFGAVQMNGGRGNLVENNVFIGGSNGVSMTQWTAAHWKEWLETPRWKSEIDRLDVRHPPYSTRYPWMSAIDAFPGTNRIVRNVFVGVCNVLVGEGPEAKPDVCGVLPPPPWTEAEGNVRFGSEPTDEEIRRAIPAFCPLPDVSSLGPRFNP